jgi:hypothetical protein
MRLAPLATLALLLAATGCALPQTYYTPPAAPPRGPLISGTLAIDLAADYARAHGQSVQQVTEARLDESYRWHVGLAGPGTRAQVLLDAVGGRVLEARLEPEPPPAPASSAAPAWSPTPPPVPPPPAPPAQAPPADQPAPDQPAPAPPASPAPPAAGPPDGPVPATVPDQAAPRRE